MVMNMRKSRAHDAPYYNIARAQCRYLPADAHEHPDTNVGISHLNTVPTMITIEQ
jgi:hypothetical protein